MQCTCTSELNIDLILNNILVCNTSRLALFKLEDSFQLYSNYDREDNCIIIIIIYFNYLILFIISINYLVALI